ncbi:MAG: DUF4215 domain-containing protein [Myxococcota bacterium]
MTELHACFVTAGACVDDGRAQDGTARELRYDNGARVVVTGSGYLRRAVYWPADSATEPCFTELYRGTTLEVVDARGCPALRDPDAGVVAPLVDGLTCAERIPPPQRCRDNVPADCSASLPYCCRTSELTEFAECLPAGLCDALGGTVVGVAGGGDGGVSSSGGVDESYRGGTAEVCAAAPRLTLGQTATFDTRVGVGDAGPGNHFNLTGMPSCAGSPAPDVLVAVAVDPGVPLAVTVTPLEPGYDLGVTAVAECPVPAVGGGQTSCLSGADQYGGGGAETLVLLRETAGDVYVLVDGFSTGNAGPFTVEVSEAPTCGDGTILGLTCTLTEGPTPEREPNGGAASATPYAGGSNAFTGQIISADGDVDWFSFKLARTATLALDITGLDAADCPGTLNLTLYDQTRSELAVGYGSVSSCPRLNGFDDEPALSALPAGDYFLSVDPSYSNTATPKDYAVRIIHFEGEDPVCTEAPQLVAGVGGQSANLTLDRGSLTRDVGLDLVPGCVGSAAPDAVVQVPVHAGKALELAVVPADVSATGPDVTLNVLAACPFGAAPSCQSANEAGPGATEVLRFPTNVDGVVYVVVDALPGPQTGNLVLSARELEPDCGDGLLTLDEQCDDSNEISGDGCSDTCQEETAVCGDGVRFPGEQCDDNNLDDGDGCSSECLCDGGQAAELEPNNTVAEANCGGGPFVAGSVPVDDVDYYLFTLDTLSEVVLETGAPALNNCSANEDSDTQFELYDANGVLVAQSQDVSGANYCDRMTVILDPGTYYVAVHYWDFSSLPVPAYRLYFTASPFQEEVEPNGSVATATLVTNDVIVASIDPAGDHDFFRVDVATNGTLTVDYGVPLVTNCNTGFASDGEFELYDGAGVPLNINNINPSAQYDGDYYGYCPRLNYPVTTGTYYLEVRLYAPSQTSPYYKLYFTVP